MHKELKAYLLSDTSHAILSPIGTVFFHTSQKVLYHSYTSQYCLFHPSQEPSNTTIHLLQSLGLGALRIRFHKRSVSSLIKPLLKSISFLSLASGKVQPHYFLSIKDVCRHAPVDARQLLISYRSPRQHVEVTSSQGSTDNLQRLVRQVLPVR